MPLPSKNASSSKSRGPEAIIKKNPLRMLIWMQKSVIFYLPHHEIPQISSHKCVWIWPFYTYIFSVNSMRSIQLLNNAILERFEYLHTYVTVHWLHKCFLKSHVKNPIIQRYFATKLNSQIRILFCKYRIFVIIRRTHVYF